MSFEMTVAWGDCDAVGIVFYPNFFRWFDTSFQHLLAEKGLDQRSMADRFGIIGTPLADAGAQFIRPATYGDVITIDSHVSDWAPNRFTVAHVVRRGDDKLAEGHEMRFWGIKDADTGRLRAAPIDPEFKTIMLS